MPKDPFLERLLVVLNDRDISLGRDDVAWAFESAKTGNEARAWVDKYLGEETLLTRDELEL